MYDLMVIGGGPAGYETAIHAALQGLRVALIEKEWIGGTCLNVGCIPTKTLYQQASVYKTLQKAQHVGVNADIKALDPVKMKQFQRSVVDELTQGIRFQLKQAKVDLVEGNASFVDAHTVKVNEVQIQAKSIMIAVGSSCSVPPIEGISSKNVFTSKTLLQLEEIPKQLVVIGGGVIGLEFASIYRQLGSEVVIIEAMDRIGMNLDQEVSKRLAFFMKKQGIASYTNAMVTRIDETEDGLRISMNHKGIVQEIEASHVLVSTGRKPNIDALNLSALGIVFNKTGIVVNEHFQTNVEHIYAIGDINGISMLAHSATFQGLHALHHLREEPSSIDFSLTPAAVFTFPEVASVGLTEEEAQAKGITFRAIKSQYKGNGKAVSMHETDGFVKLLVAEERIIGAHIIGYQASTLIHECAALMHANMPFHKLKSMIHAHPTLSEVIQSALLGL